MCRLVALEASLRPQCLVCRLLKSGIADAEANKYAALHHRQVVVIFRVYGYYQKWGILALEPVGEAIRGRQTCVEK